MRFSLPSRKAIACALVPLAILCSTASGQDSGNSYSIVFRGVAVPEALAEFARVTGADILFDTDLVQGRPAVFCTMRAAGTEDILRCITEKSGLDYYRTSSGTFVVIERAAAAPQKGTLAGVVVDAATGEPLPFANVYLEDLATGTAANESGFFSFAALLPGDYTIVATHLGFRPTANIVSVVPASSRRARVELVSEPVRYSPVVVDGLSDELEATYLGRGQLDDVASIQSGGVSAGDVVRASTGISGVGARNPLAELYIQGGSSGEHVVRLDGAPVFNPQSFGTLVGAFSPLAIGRLTVHKAGFGAGVGSQLSGVVDLEHDISVSQPFEINVLIDPVSANLSARSRIRIGNATGAVAVSGRTALWNVYRVPTLETSLREWNLLDPVLSATLRGDVSGAVASRGLSGASDVSFDDLHGAGRFALSPYRTLYFSGYHGRAAVGSRGLSVVPGSETYALTRDRYAWDNTVFSVRHAMIAGARALVGIGARFSRHTMEQGYQSVDSVWSAGTSMSADVELGLTPDLEAARLNKNENEVTQLAVEVTFDYAVSASNQLEASLELESTTSSFAHDTEYFANFQGTGGSTKAVLSLSNTWRRGETAVELGVRSTYVPGRQTVYPEPRLSVFVDRRLPSEAIIAGRLSTGVYRQFITPFDLSNVAPSALVPSLRFWLPTDDEVSPPLAYHVAGEVSYTRLRGMVVGLELYHKALPQILALDYGAIIDQSANIDGLRGIIENASGSVSGFSITAEHPIFIGKVDAAYTFSRSRRTFPSRFGEREVSTPWNVPNAVRVRFTSNDVGGFELKTQLDWRWGAGWAFRQAYYDFLAAHNSAMSFPPFDLSQPDNHALPDYVRVDVGLGYTLQLASMRAQVRLDVLNILDRRNVIDQAIVPGQGSGFSALSRRLPGVQPVLSAVLSF